jgi:phage gpG-like protein
VVEAILNQIPPPASEVNSAISQPISRVVHKGMAKQAWHRFATARDLSDTLSKALRNEPIEAFDPQRRAPRLQRATKALEGGDLQFAGEILGELEAEGHMDSGIGLLRRQLDSVSRRKTLSHFSMPPKPASKKRKILSLCRSFPKCCRSSLIMRSRYP